MIDSDEVKQRIDIVEYISRYTPLKKAGSQYKGICPFHTEKTPSFYVYPDQGSWHCYGACSTGGDVFSFLMKKENLEFAEAAEILAREAGVEPTASGGADHGKRTSLYELNAEAGRYFAAMLKDSPGAAPPHAYLQRRGIDAETVEKFGLGFAPAGWDGLRDHLSAQGYDYETQLLAGAIKRNEERGSYYDAFHNRVIVPIRDNMGRIIGFGGRVLDDSQPKYLNTADTPLFKKSRVIFGIDVARDAIRDAGSVIIVEGYMDVIAAHQYGFTNVVACMGTALTSEQLRQLQRYTRKFMFALDADSAGQQATIRGLNQARQGLAHVSRPTVRPGGGLRLEQRLGAELFILSMPDGMDPDDVIRRDPERWKALVEQAQPLVDYFFGVIAREYDLSSAGGKAAAVSALAPLIAELNDDIEQQHYVQKLSRLVSVDEMTISGRVHASAATTSLPPGAHLKPRRRPGPAKTPSLDSGPVWNDAPPAGDAPLGDGAQWYDSIGAQPTRAPAPAHKHAHVDQEFYLLANFFSDPDSIISMTARAHELDIAPPLPQDWQNIENQEMFRALTLYLTGDAQWKPEFFREGVAEQLHPRLDRLLGDADRLPDFDREELYPDMLKVLVRIRIDHLKSDNQGIKFAVAEAQRAGDMAAVRSFDAASNRNLRELNHLQRTLAVLTRVMAINGHAYLGVKIR